MLREALEQNSQLCLRIYFPVACIAASLSATRFFQMLLLSLTSSRSKGGNNADIFDIYLQLWESTGFGNKSIVGYSSKMTRFFMEYIHYMGKQVI